MPPRALPACESESGAPPARKAVARSASKGRVAKDGDGADGVSNSVAMVTSPWLIRSQGIALMVASLMDVPLASRFLEIPLSWLKPASNQNRHFDGEPVKGEVRPWHEEAAFGGRSWSLLGGHGSQPKPARVRSAVAVAGPIFRRVPIPAGITGPPRFTGFTSACMVQR